MKTRKKSDTKISSDFELIYRAASTENAEGLAGLTDGKISVDVCDELGLFTPAAKLAAEGNDDAVKLLMAFHARKDFIAMGYACVGNVKKAEQFRKEFGVNIKMLAMGAAMHKDHTYAEQLRKQFELRPDWLVFGAAFAGHTEYLEFVSTRLTDHQKSGAPLAIGQLKLQEQIMCAKMKGLVMGGHVQEAVKILDANKNSTSDHLLRVAIKAAARTANMDVLESFIMRNGQNPYHLNYYYQVAAIGAAKGGHFALARELLNKTSEHYRKDAKYKSKPNHDHILAVIKAGLINGHFNEVFKYFSDLLKIDRSFFLSPQVNMSAYVNEFSELAEMAARRGDLSLVEKIYREHKIPLFNIVKAMDVGGRFYNKKLLTHGLAFVDNHEFLNALTAAAMTLASDPQALKSIRTAAQGWTSMFDNQCFSLFKQCAEHAKKINVLIKKYHFDFNQAEAFLESQEIRSVLGFAAFRGKLLDEFFPKMLSNTRRLSDADLRDMAEKYMLYMAKGYVLKELDAYLSRNYIAYYQHYNRVSSLRDACADAVSRQTLTNLVNFQHNLFRGDIIATPNSSKPKHEQPLKNKISPDDDCYQTIEKISQSTRLNK